MQTISIRGITLRVDPAREPCFKVVHAPTEMRYASIDSAEGVREVYHRNVNNEIQSAEIAAQTLVDFPDAPWNLRLDLARQCWDEVRHAKLYYRCLRALGGYKGEFPVTNHEWSVACLFTSLAARLAIQNRTFEGGSLEVLEKMAKAHGARGDEQGASITEAVLNDEIQHVRFANHWIKQLVRDNPRVLLDIAGAVSELKRIMHALSPQPGELSIDGVDLAAQRRVFALDEQDRTTANFSESELEVMRCMDEDRRPSGMPGVP